MEALNLEPFPRQVLMGGPSASLSWYSQTFDLKDFKSLAWLYTVYASLPAGVAVPAVLYLEGSNDFNGPFEDLVVDGIDPTIGSTEAGVVNDPPRYLRARVAVVQDEMPMVAVRCVARGK